MNYLPLFDPFLSEVPSRNGVYSFLLVIRVSFLLLDIYRQDDDAGWNVGGCTHSLYLGFLSTNLQYFLSRALQTS